MIVLISSYDIRKSDKKDITTNRMKSSSGDNDLYKNNKDYDIKNILKYLTKKL